MTDRQLRYIIEIAKEGGISAAAQKLNISQPSLSSLLSNVEAEVGTKIFDRSVSPLALTFAGEKYIEAAKKVLSTMNDLQNQIYDIEESRKGLLRIGCGPQYSPLFIPLVLPDMIDKYPDVEFRITEDYQQTLAMDLLAGNLDALVYSGMIKNPMLKYEMLAEYEHVLMAPRGFIATLLPVRDEREFPCVDLHSLEDKNFVLIKPGHQLRTVQDQLFRELNFKPKIILETDNWITCLRMVESAIAFTILPNMDSGLWKHNFDSYSLKKRYFRHLYLCYRKNTNITRIMNDFLVTTRQLFRK